MIKNDSLIQSKLSNAHKKFTEINLELGSVKAINISTPLLRCLQFNYVKSLMYRV